MDRNILQTRIKEMSKEAKESLCRTLHVMVNSTRARLEGPVQGVLSLGLNGMDANAFEAGIECILEEMPESVDKNHVTMDLAFFKENRLAIISDHHLALLP